MNLTDKGKLYGMLNNIFGTLAEPNDNFYELSDDPIALLLDTAKTTSDPMQLGAVISNRHLMYPNDEHKPGPTASEESQEQAKEIRRYYLGKLTFSGIASKNPLSRFRKDLFSFLSLKPGKMSTKYTGMAVRLLDFYHEDITLDGFDDTVKQPVIDVNDRAERTKRMTKLTFLTKTQGPGTKINFWFEDENNQLCLIDCVRTNEFMQLFESRVNEGPIIINGYKQPDSVVGRKTSYYDIRGWALR